MIVCKVCGATNEQGATFCGTCGSFLEWSGEAVQPDPGTQPTPGNAAAPPPIPPVPPGGASGETPTTDMSTVSTPVAPDPGPPGSIVCPNCGQANDPTRVYCSRCATELAPVATTAEVVAPPPTGRGVPPVALLGGIGALAVLAVLAFVFLVPKGTAAPSSEAGTETPPVAQVSASPSAVVASPSASAAVESTPPSVEPSSAPTPPPPTGKIAFTARENGDADVWVWDAASGDQEPLADGDVDQSDPAWSTDGSKVVYVNASPPFSPNGGTPEEGLRVVKANGSEAKVFDFTHHDVDRNPSWSPDDKVIAFASTREHGQNKNLDIYTRVFEDTAAETLLADDPADDWDPAWSPDGDRIVFVSERNGDAHLFTMTPTGKQQRPLKLGGGIFDDPTWSPDGDSLAFTLKDNENARERLFVAGADGSGMRPVGDFDTDVHDPTWSPDSKLIAVAKGGNGSMIAIVDATTGAEVTELGVDGATNSLPDWR